mgnify:CR=1 FL=1|tara:strand:- start:488 stop:682 length:195 start_codon:yes stop_codon:yes gene_type:complete
MANGFGVLNMQGCAAVMHKTGKPNGSTTTACSSISQGKPLKRPTTRYDRLLALTTLTDANFVEP